MYRDVVEEAMPNSNPNPNPNPKVALLTTGDYMLTAAAGDYMLTAARCGSLGALWRVGFTHLWNLTWNDILV